MIVAPAIKVVRNELEDPSSLLRAGASVQGVSVSDRK